VGILRAAAAALCPSGSMSSSKAAPPLPKVVATDERYVQVFLWTSVRKRLIAHSDQAEAHAHSIAAYSSMGRCIAAYGSFSTVCEPQSRNHYMTAAKRAAPNQLCLSLALVPSLSLSRSL